VEGDELCGLDWVADDGFDGSCCVGELL